jgi:hypothetical protein
MKFFVKDCPEHLSLFQWICDQTNFSEAIKDVAAPITNSDLIEIPHNVNITDLINDTLSSLDAFGIKGWQTAKGNSKAYGGLSMVYNPDLINKIDPNQSTLGTPENSPDKFYYSSTEKFDSIRNTYFDSYGFRKLSPCITETNLKNFIEKFSLSPTRSRIAVLDAAYYNKVGEEFLWHRDETIFENLRINIPIKTDESFLFQLENKTPVHLSVGKLYTWDTNLPHRVYSTKKTELKRIHLVLGFSPWLDYDSNDDSFSTNQFFGKIHPFDILLNGHAHPLIGR